MSGTPAWSVSGGQAEISDDNDTFASNMAARVAPGTCCGGTGCRRVSQVVCRTGLYTFGILLYDKVFLFKHICEPECLNKNAFYNYGIFSGYNRCIMMACVGTLRHRVVKFPAFGEMSMGS